MINRRQRMAIKGFETLTVENAQLRERIAELEKQVAALKMEIQRYARLAETGQKTIAPPPFAVPRDIPKPRMGRPPVPMHMKQRERAKEEPVDDKPYDIGWQVTDATDLKGSGT